MTVAAAQKFIHRIQTEQALVSRINGADDETALREILSELDLPFNYQEFEQAYHNTLTRCQTTEQADAVKEIKTWWDYLGHCLSHNKGESEPGPNDDHDE